MLCIKKYIIKIILIIAFLLYSFNSILFSEIDFNLIVPFGYNYTFSDIKMTDRYISLVSLKDRDYYEVGVQSQVGYNFDTKNSIFKSIMADNFASMRVFDKLEVSSFSMGISLGFAIRDNGY